MGGAFEGPGAGFAFGAEVVAGGLVGFVDEVFAADDEAIGEVANAVKEDGGDGEVGEDGLVVAGLQHFGGVLGDGAAGFGWGFAFVFSEGEAHEAAVDAGGFGPFCGIEAGALVAEAGSDEAFAGFFAVAFGSPADGFAVAGPAVLGGVGDDAGSNGVEVDVGGDGAGGDAVLDDEAFEAFFPEGAGAVVGAVEPLGEALEEGFHELAEVVHAVGEAGVDLGGVCFVVLLSGFGEFFGDGGDEGFGVGGVEAMEEFLVGEAVGGEGRDFEEKVEVVGHEAVGEDAAAGEVFLDSEEFAEVFAL